MKIDRSEAKRIADLAHLEFDDAALERMAGEMTKILSYIDQLREVDVTGFETAAASEATPMREDVPRAPVDRDAVAANAPAFSEDGHFIVPKVIGD
ncbi:MAG: aspartyl-tRNA(Asn)/glutamyl-tRNA(Gln) amidotransferase subunit [Thermoanaerobaculia bacterium]|jgi:aspartyl-tRNA(Asn)/glutamyl-tRNA(Gln) amidotransferase subunit C|nr:aspartyl-tRNA(Asn)/glutamyl-tRNA(Gln) amidotransferase subunit [Thermoanaerobaculia bacterium]